jgi:hypothetical protein
MAFGIICLVIAFCSDSEIGQRMILFSVIYNVGSVIILEINYLKDEIKKNNK